MAPISPTGRGRAETVRFSLSGRRVWPYSVATQAVTRQGWAFKNSTSSRPSVVPPKTQSLYIAVSSRCDKIPADRLRGGVADEDGAEHVGLRRLELAERQHTAALTLAANAADDAAEPVLRQYAEQNLARAVQVLRPAVAGRVI